MEIYYLLGLRKRNGNIAKGVQKIGMWLCTPVILTLGKLRLEYQKFRVSLGNIVNSRSACI